MEDMAQRNRLYLGFGAAGIAAYAGAMCWAGKLDWQHLGLPVLAWACIAPQQGPRRFMLAWWPMVLFWLGYDSMRFCSDSLLSRASIEPPLRWEQTFFPAPGGEIWPFLFSRWRESNAGDNWVAVASMVSNLVYFSHICAVPLFLLGLWLRRRDLLFRRIVWSFSVLHVAGLLTYMAYPAAPPWWVYENGMTQPTPQHHLPMGSVSGSVPRQLFQFSANKFAAIPSLHGAYPFLLTLVLLVHGSSRRSVALAACYTALMWFACVFLNQHYIIDLVIGALWAVPAIPAARRPFNHLAGSLF
jgi:hypothetical protein